MRKINDLVIFLLLISLSQNALAWFDHSKNASHANDDNHARGNCAPATAYVQLELNNVRALIETGGKMWQDRSTNNASYEVPKGSGTSVIFAGALWLGGEDVNGQLKIAAQTFGSGNDFWTGPLIATGAQKGNVSADVCERYDRFFGITRQEVLEFVAYKACLATGDPNCAQEYIDRKYEVPDVIKNWPAHGDVSIGEDFYLAPFFDADSNGIYDWTKGDYPDFDIRGDGCQSACGNGGSRRVRLFGDQTYWWVFNDNGNIHTETTGDPIGMEIRAQAFAFATNDEVNDMTFYNYELHNRSSQTLKNTYFGQWVDSDVGCSGDDYVGCDVERGLGYAYNADAVDDDGCQGAVPYGANPPAVGIDFFEGPYQDNDGIDNPGPTIDNNFFVSCQDALNQDGIVYKGMGVGYGDGCPDNERFGMRKFTYYTRLDQGGSSWGSDPGNATEYYNYMKGIWLDGTQFVYGGNGHFSDPAANPNLPCDYMFAGDSDPQGFGAGCVSNLPDWSEFTNSNPGGDRRFLQSAGPFTLEPGAVNNITVGVVYARATGGGLFASVEKLRLADDKAQALFDNCFSIVEGPDAPDVEIQEMDREIILYLDNTKGSSNNYVESMEDYEVVDPFIITPDSLLGTNDEYDNTYNFEGYQIFQLKHANVSASELHDIDKARLVGQCDIKNNVTQLINWFSNESNGTAYSQEMVLGSNEGIKHSFKITEDEFATGDRRLINHKKYYYMAIAYGYNNFKNYDINDPLALDGQKKPYLSSRKNGKGGAIRSYVGIPHIPSPEANGTHHQAEYGTGPEITRIEGKGNGGLSLELTDETEASIINNNYEAHPRYKMGRGPVNIKVIDPLNVIDGNYQLKFNKDHSLPNNGAQSLNRASWTLINMTTGDSVQSNQTIEVANEQLILDWGLSVEIEQVVYDKVGGSYDYVELISAKIIYQDSSKQWLTGVPDLDGLNDQNWIRVGTLNDANGVNDANGCNTNDYNDHGGLEDETFESILNGTWAPYISVGSEPVASYPCIRNMPVSAELASTVSLTGQNKLVNLNNVDIVFTKDKSRWTRCPVIEMQDNPDFVGGVNKMAIKNKASVDKNGLSAGQNGYNAFDGDLVSATGMGWFPGYAIDLETGQRLNIIFSEDSWLAYDNGNDMMWNPTQTLYSGIGEPVFGGKHYVYVFRALENAGSNDMPVYDQGAFSYANLSSGGSGPARVFKHCTWVGMPMLMPDSELLSSDVRLSFRVKKAYSQFASTGVYSDSLIAGGTENQWNPLYEFDTKSIATLTNFVDTGMSALDLIGVVPNPYYAYSQYEENRLDNLVKFTNLPEKCTITIFTSAGALVRQFKKDDPLTSFDWDLKNFSGIPIASGTYIIHIKGDNLPGQYGSVAKRANERVIKWFGAMRPPDLDNF